MKEACDEAKRILPAKRSQLSTHASGMLIEFETLMGEEMEGLPQR